LDNLKAATFTGSGFLSSAYLLSLPMISFGGHCVSLTIVSKDDATGTGRITNDSGAFVGI
jgi:hypothetical protein